MRNTDGSLIGKMLWDTEYSDPLAPDRIVAGCLGFVTDHQRSADGTWEMANTDVGSCFRRDLTEARPRWKNCVTDEDVIGVQGGTTFVSASERQAYAVGMAPSDSNVAYVFRGNYVVRTDDKGLTWNVCAAFDNTVASSSANSQKNGHPTYGSVSERHLTNKIAIDPYNADHVLIGAPGLNGDDADGLWRTRDGGATAALVAGLPIPDAQYPVIVALFDHTVPAVGGFCPNAYVFIGGVGKQWHLLTDMETATPTVTNTAFPGGQANSYFIDDNGRMLCATSDGGQTDGIYTYTVAGGWVFTATTFTPTRIAGKKGDPNRVLLYYSRDGMELVQGDLTTRVAYWTATQVWRGVKPFRTFTGPYRINTDEYGFINQLHGYGDDVIVTHGVGTAKTTWAELEADPSTVPWVDDTYGLEDLVNAIHRTFATADGEDRIFLANDDKAVIAYPREGTGHGAALQAWPDGLNMGAWSDQAQFDRNYIANSYAPDSGNSGTQFSADGGKTWTDTPTKLNAFEGTVCWGATPQEMFLVGGGNRWPIRTTDQGATKTDINLFDGNGNQLARVADGTGAGFDGSTRIRKGNYMVQVEGQPGRVWLLNWSATPSYGGLYINDIGTGDFRKVIGEDLPAGERIGLGENLFWNPSMRATKDGAYLYLTGGNITNFTQQDGDSDIIRVNLSDYSQTRLSGIDEVHSFDLGAPLRAGMPETLWVPGWNDDSPCIAFSVDLGDTWEFLADLPNQPRYLDMIAASPSRFGELAIGPGSQGQYRGRWLAVA